jgi:hypothetical protein
MTTARFVRSLPLLVACMVLGACATTRYTQSAIETLPRGVEGRPGSRAVLDIDGLKVGIEALDRSPEQERVRRLVLRVEFEPSELGYSFDPGQVRLRTSDGREWHAERSGYHPVYPKAVFDLGFGVVIEPGERVELVLDGLARGTKRLDPVTLQLSRRRGRSIDRMYWLEAVGYAMAILTYPYGGM